MAQRASVDTSPVRQTRVVPALKCVNRYSAPRDSFTSCPVIRVIATRNNGGSSMGSQTNGTSTSEMTRAQRPPPPGSLHLMFERFTDRARRVLVLAQEEARLLDHSFMGTEHILLGLISEQQGVAAVALERSGITLEAARHQVQEMVGSQRGTGGGSPPFTPRAKKVLELSLREALGLGHSYIGTEHLLLGLIRGGEGAGARVIERLGVNLDHLYGDVIALMSGTAEEVEGGVGEMGRGGMPVSDPPGCPQCRAGLVEHGRYRVIAVPAEDPAPELVDLEVRVLYCGRCGATFGTA